MDIITSSNVKDLDPRIEEENGSLRGSILNLACAVNLGREFLKLIHEHFPQNIPRKDKLEKMINRHTIKMSYSGMERIILSQNTKILNERREDVTATKIMCLPEG